MRGRAPRRRGWLAPGPWVWRPMRVASPPWVPAPRPGPDSTGRRPTGLPRRKRVVAVRSQFSPGGRARPWTGEILAPIRPTPAGCIRLRIEAIPAGLPRQSTGWRSGEKRRFDAEPWPEGQRHARPPRAAFHQALQHEQHCRRRHVAVLGQYLARDSAGRRRGGRAASPPTRRCAARRGESPTTRCRRRSGPACQPARPATARRCSSIRLGTRGDSVISKP